MSAALRALIVDDEPPSRLRLQQLLGAIPSVTIVGEARTGVEAVEAIGRLRPDLVFLDVVMPGGDAFDVLDQLEWLPPAIVFVTAFEAHAVRAFETDAIDYLLKPVEAHRLELAVRRAQEEVAEPDDLIDARAGRLTAVVNADSRPLERLAVRVGRRIKLVRVAEVECIEAAGNYINVCTPDAVHVVRESLQRLEARLDAAVFVRIHRSTIVNTRRVSEIEPHLHGDYVVRLESGRRVILSRTFRPNLRGRFGPEF